MDGRLETCMVLNFSSVFREVVHQRAEVHEFFRSSTIKKKSSQPK